jgi:glycine cleavage system H protein
MPLTGEIAETNEELNDSPEQVNSDPYAGGWMIRIKPSDSINTKELLDAEKYASEIG